MRRRLRTFFLVGIATTLIDIAIFAVAWRSWDLLPAGLASLIGAAAFSYVANRFITFANDERSRWVRHPMSYALTALITGSIHLGALLFLAAVGTKIWAAKLTAIVAAAAVRWLAYRWVLFTEVRQVLSERQATGPAPGSVRLSVVVPAFNEAERIASTIAALRNHLDTVVQGQGLEIVVVDDGSSDATAAVAAAAGATVLVQDANKGKGAAVRRGMLSAQGRSIVFTDADLAYPPHAVADIMAELEAGWDIVVGSRRHAATKTVVKARPIRDLGSWVINAMTHIVLLGHFRDTQCGIKGFRSDVARSLFRRCRIDRFGFDVEIFCIAELDGRSLNEVPVTVSNSSSSSVRLIRDTTLLVIDLFRIRRWAGEGVYRRPVADRGGASAGQKMETTPPPRSGERS